MFRSWALALCHWALAQLQTMLCKGNLRFWAKSHKSIKITTY